MTNEMTEKLHINSECCKNNVRQLPKSLEYLQGNEIMIGIYDYCLYVLRSASGSLFQIFTSRFLSKIAANCLI